MKERHKHKSMDGFSFPNCESQPNFPYFIENCLYLFQFHPLGTEKHHIILYFEVA